jgi:hypothetical protein
MKFRHAAAFPRSFRRSIKGETVQVLRMAPEEACSADILVMVRWQGRSMAVPLSQLAAVNEDESTANAIGDWHYWISQGYLF